MWMCTTGLITGNGLAVSCSSKYNQGKKPGVAGMDRWGFSTLLSGLGHSDPVLGVKYMLLQPAYFQFLFQTEFSVSWRDLRRIVKLLEIFCCRKPS